MSFYSKYEILALLRDDAPSTGVKTFSARQIASGQTVGVHLLFETPPGQPAAILERVRSLGPEKVSQVIEVGSHEGTSYVVTAEWNRPQSFDEWLGKPPAPAPATRPSADNYGKAGSWRVPTAEFIRKSDPGASPAASAPPMPEPGGFTRMFSISPRAAADPSSVSSAMHPSAIRPVPTPPPFVPITPPTAPPSAARPAPIQADEPTRYFQTSPPATASSAAAPVPPASTGPGEFTRMFQAPAANSPSQVIPAAGPQSVSLTEETRKVDMSTVRPAGPPPPAATAPATPGEFTRMFQVPSPNSPTQAPLPPTPDAPEGPGEFTRMFQSPAAAQVTPPKQVDMSVTKTMQIPVIPGINAPGSPTPAPGEFTQKFQALSQQDQSTPVTPAQSVPAAAVPPPGEFTQMFQAATPSATPSMVTPIINRGTVPPVQTAPPPGDFSNIFKTGASPVQPPPASGPGEFTKIFESPIPRPMGEAPPPPMAPPPPSSGPGEFTKFFQVPVESPAPRPHPALNDPFGKSAPPPTPPQSGGAGEFTQMFGVPSRPTPGGASDPYKPSYPPSFAPPSTRQSATGAFAAPSAPHGSSSMGGSPAGPGEYTQMFSRPAPSSTPADPTAAAPPVATPPNYLPLVIIFGILFLIAAGLVIYFWLHR